MKKVLVLGVLVCLLLCGCIQREPEKETPEESTDELETEDCVEDSETLRAQLAYYEELVVDLQAELLNLKTELYASRVEYEERIAELEAQKAPSNGGGNGSSQASTDFQYTVTNGFATVTAYTGIEKVVEIPATIDGYTVTAIGDRAFLDHFKLTSVTLPKTVTSIGWFAFSGCIALEQITVPASVSSISYGAFQNCPSTMQMDCISGSYAEQYARSYGIRVVSASS